MNLFKAFMHVSLAIVTLSSAYAVDVPRKINFASLAKIADHTLNIEVRTAGLEENVEWVISPSDTAIFYAKLRSLKNAKVAYSPLNIEDPENGYSGLYITITDSNGRKLIPIHVYKERVSDERLNLITLDPLRDLEYWLWSTGAPENLTSVQKALPIIDFKQCAALGHRIVETTPRQCLLANGNIFLDVMERPTQESLKIKTFDDCLVDGQALINTFPRRCIAAGGHVFAEPPRLKKVDPAQDASVGFKEFSMEDFK